MRRREFITYLGAAAAPWPRGARAQTREMPVIGFVHPATPELYGPMLVELREGLKQAGYVEGQNVAVEYRWANNQPEQLPALAADLVQRRVAVIVTAGGTRPALAVKAATSTIPI